jgi:hypothetical protein
MPSLPVWLPELLPDYSLHLSPSMLRTYIRPRRCLRLIVEDHSLSLAIIIALPADVPIRNTAKYAFGHFENRESRLYTPPRYLTLSR